MLVRIYFASRDQRKGKEQRLESLSLCFSLSILFTLIGAPILIIFTRNAKKWSTRSMPKYSFLLHPESRSIFPCGMMKKIRLKQSFDLLREKHLVHCDIVNHFINAFFSSLSGSKCLHCNWNMNGWKKLKSVCSIVTTLLSHLYNWKRKRRNENFADQM